MRSCKGLLTSCKGRLTRCKGSPARCKSNSARCKGRPARCKRRPARCKRRLARCKRRLARCKRRLARCKSGPARPNPTARREKQEPCGCRKAPVARGKQKAPGQADSEPFVLSQAVPSRMSLFSSMPRSSRRWTCLSAMMRPADLAGSLKDEAMPGLSSHFMRAKRPLRLTWQ